MSINVSSCMHACSKADYYIFLFVTFQNHAVAEGDDISMRAMRKEQEMNAEPLSDDQDEERYTTSFSINTKSEQES